MTNDSKRKSQYFDEFIGRKLRQVRKVAGLTQAELGRCVGLSFQQVQKHENGSVRISAGRLLSYSLALNTPIEFFFDGITPDLEVRGPLAARYLDLSDLGESKSSCIKIIANAQEDDVHPLAEFLEHFISDEPTRQIQSQNRAPDAIGKAQ